MAALGRIVQIIGWLWFAAAIFGEALGLPDLNIFPAILLIFVARALRRQAKRQSAETEDHSRPPDFPGEEPAQEERPLNTERQQPPPRPRVEPIPQPDPVAEVREHNELLEKILAADEAAPRPGPMPTTAGSDEDRRPPITSAEMVAEARKRWDRKD